MKLINLLILSILCCVSSAYSQSVAPFVKNGILDLRNYNVSENIVELKGDWEFYWGKFLMSSDFTNEDRKKPLYVEGPGRWNNFVINGKKIGNEGFATYRLIVKLPNTTSNSYYAISVPTILTAYNLYIDGVQVLKSGKVTRTKTDFEMEVHNKTVTFKSDRSEIEIIIHVSNFVYTAGGMRTSLLLGASEKIALLDNQKTAFSTLFFAVLFSFGLYFIKVYLDNRTIKTAFYFGMACLSLSYFSFHIGTHAFFPILFEPFKLSFEWENRFSFMATCIGSIAMVLYKLEQYQEQKGRGFKIYRYLWIPSMLTVILPYGLFMKTILFYLGFCVFSFCYASYVVINGGKRDFKNMDMGCMALLMVTIVIDIGMAVGISKLTFYITPFTLVFFIMVQAMILSQQYAGVFRTVAKQSEELSIKNKELQKLDKLKDSILANTSHELKTPLNGIMGIAESILDFDETRLKNKLKDNVKVILDNSRRLSYLVNDLLDKSALEHGNITAKLVSVKLYDIVEQSKLLFSANLRKKGIELINEVDPGLPYVLADPIRLQQIFHNLIHNAIKFVDEGTINIAAKEDNNKVKVTISDTGIGIHPQDQKRIFDAFEKLGAKPGTGLGLTITSDLIKLHGSEIKLVSSLGEGAAFSFSLNTTKNTPDIEFSELAKPVSFENVQHRMESIDMAQNDSRRSSASVLIVDDEILNLQILKNHLNKYRVYDANSGKEALAILEKECPDLILLDIMMPGLNGIDTCKIIRNKFTQNELPIIFLTAKNRISDLIAGFDVGCNDYLPKPYLKGELLSRVENQLSTLRGTKHLSDINLFANSISKVNDTADLAKTLFNYLRRIPCISDACLMNEDSKLEYFGNWKQFVKEKHRRDAVSIRNLNESLNENALVNFTFDELDEYLFYIKLSEKFKKMDLEFLKALNEQSILVRRSLATIYFKTEKLPIYYEVFRKLNKIEFVKYDKGLTTLHGPGLDNVKETYEVTLKELKLIFQDSELLRCRRNILVNPQKIVGIKKQTRSSMEFSLNSGIYVPIGRTYVDLIKKSHPQFFSR